MKRAINKPMGKTRKLSPNLLSTLAGHFSPLLLRVFHCSASCESFERIFQEMALSTQGNSGEVTISGSNRWITKNLLPRIKKLLHFNLGNFKENVLTVSISASFTRNNNFRCFLYPQIPTLCGSSGFIRSLSPTDSEWSMRRSLKFTFSNR